MKTTNLTVLLACLSLAACNDSSPNEPNKSQTKKPGQATKTKRSPKQAPTKPAPKCEALLSQTDVVMACGVELVQEIHQSTEEESVVLCARDFAKSSEDRFPPNVHFAIWPSDNKQKAVSGFNYLATLSDTKVKAEGLGPHAYRTERSDPDLGDSNSLMFVEGRYMVELTAKKHACPPDSLLKMAQLVADRLAKHEE